MTDRIPCSVPFCKRTAAASKYPEGTRIICGKCWRLGDMKFRRVYRRAKRVGNLELAYNCWDHVLEQAIERRAGVTA